MDDGPIGQEVLIHGHFQMPGIPRSINHEGDPHEVPAVMKNLAKQGMTLVVVTPEMGFASEVGDTVVVMDEGYVVERGDAREVLGNPQEPRTQSFLEKVL